ncbi:MAG: SDR family oxidoreductase [Planctomycetota bacterium]
MQDSTRRALVTAGRTGIGAAIAASLRREGLDVWTTSRTPADGDARCLRLDAASAPDEIERVVGTARPDVLVHAAAAFPPFGPAARVDAADVRAALEVKVEFGLRVFAAAAPFLRAGGSGRVVFIGSAAGALGAAGQAGYAAANAALVGLVRSIAVEEGRRGVTANLVVPGLVETPRLVDSVPEDARARVVARSAVGRIGTPAEVADVVAFLCASERGFVTGATLHVDGGLGLGVGAEDGGA